MMGNVWEWVENPKNGDYMSIYTTRVLRGGSYLNNKDALSVSEFRYGGAVDSESDYVGFRVASNIPANKGDANRDGHVNLDDFIILKQNYNTLQNATWEQGDFNYDEKVNIDDFIILKQNYGL